MKKDPLGANYRFPESPPLKRHFSLVTALVLVCSLIASAQTSAGPVVRPNFRGPHFPANPELGIPFETPASLACVYRVVKDIVAGCSPLIARTLPNGGSDTIAVVNALDYPTAEDDLNVFSRRFSVPECDDANPCFSVIFASGRRPPTDSLWASNAANVIEYAHAFAPKARIILVEAATATLPDLMVAVQRANELIAASPTGRGQVLMPWGSFEAVSNRDCDPLFTTPGVIYIAGNGGGPGFLEYPATSPNVIAVGGTSIERDNRGNFVGEASTTFWAGGMSAIEPRPSYQDGIESIVHERRGVPDLAFASDPFASPEIYYDSIPLDGFVGWEFTGSVGFGEAFWGGVINRAGGTAQSTVEELTLMYSNLGNTKVFRNVTRGMAIGVHAGPGWDFVTGLGVDVGLIGK